MVSQQDLIDQRKKIEATEQENKINEEDAKRIAYEYAKNNVKNFDKYILIGEVKFNESYKKYEISFGKKIDRYWTLDQVHFSIDEYGNITFYSAKRQGIFDKYLKKKVDEEDINEKLTKAIKDKYKEDLKKYDLEKERTFIIKDNKLILECMVEIELNSKTGPFLDGFYYSME